MGARFAEALNPRAFALHGHLMQQCQCHLLGFGNANQETMRAGHITGRRVQRQHHDIKLIIGRASRAQGHGLVGGFEHGSRHLARGLCSRVDAGQRAKDIWAQVVPRDLAVCQLFDSGAPLSWNPPPTAPLRDGHGDNTEPARQFRAAAHALDSQVQYVHEAKINASFAFCKRYVCGRAWGLNKHYVYG